MSPRLPKYSRAGGRPKSTQRDSNDWSHVESKQAAPAKVHDVAARLREIPPDTRSLTGQLLGDPLPQRSALFKEKVNRGEVPFDG
jgi:hypothetical protein